MQPLNDTLDQRDLIDILWDIPSESSRIHFLLRCTQNILQDRSHLGSQIKVLVHLKKLKLYQASFLTTTL